MFSFTSGLLPWLWASSWIAAAYSAAASAQSSSTLKISNNTKTKRPVKKLSLSRWRLDQTNNSTQNVVFDEIGGAGGSNSSNNTGSIVGGTLVAEGAYPAFAIPDGYPSRNGLCGSTLIAPDILATAAHCFGVFQNFDIYLGTNDLYGAGAVQTIVAVQEYIHPDFDSYFFRNDIMLVKLAFGSTITPLSYNRDAALPADGEKVKAIGFGVTEDSNVNPSTALREVVVEVVNSDTCVENYDPELYGSVVSPDLMVCAGNAGKDSCQGDSGGPLLSVNGDVIEGLTSWGIGCGEEGLPGVYTRISTFDDWIQETICGLSDYAPDDCVLPPDWSPTPTYNFSPSPAPFDFSQCSNGVVDFCLYEQDGYCDAGIYCESILSGFHDRCKTAKVSCVSTYSTIFSLCSPGPPISDCFDCDPLQNYSYQGCDVCIENGGVYCWYFSICVSPESAESAPDACFGAEWASSCESTPPPLECDLFADICPYDRDGECDAGFYTSCKSHV